MKECARCGKEFPESQMSKLWDKYICFDCRKYFSYFNSGGGQDDKDDKISYPVETEFDEDSGILPDPVSRISSAKRLFSADKVTSNPFLNHIVLKSDLDMLCNGSSAKKSSRRISDIASLYDYFKDDD